MSAPIVVSKDRHAGVRGGIVLAAGSSSRAGCVKALAPLDGRTMLESTTQALFEAGIGRVVVVVGEPHADAIVARLPACCEPVRSARSQLGMVASLGAGLERLGAVDVVVVSLVDHPRVAGTTIRALVHAIANGAAVARPLFEGRRGYPFALGAAARTALLSAAPNASLRDVLETLGPVHDVEVDDGAVLDDFDTAAALVAAGTAARERRRT